MASQKCHATLIRDQMDEPAAVKLENVSVTRGQTLIIRMRAGGGFVAKFQPAHQATA